MKFKDLINYYETLEKKELIKKLTDKNVKLLEQEDEIERLTKELKEIKSLEKGHKRLNGDLRKEINKLKEDLNSPLKTMREVGVL